MDLLAVQDFIDSIKMLSLFPEKKSKEWHNQICIPNIALWLKVEGGYKKASIKMWTT